MATPPALCGSFLGSKRSLVAFTWSVMTVLTLFAFLTAISWTIKINSHYRYLERMYGTDDAADNNNEHGCGKGGTTLTRRAREATNTETIDL